MKMARMKIVLTVGVREGRIEHCHPEQRSPNRTRLAPKSAVRM